jgi:hypothetical protein
MQQALLARESGNLETALALADSTIEMTRAVIARTGQQPDYLALFLIRRADLRLDANRAGDAAADAREAARLFDAAAEPATKSSSQGRARLALGRALLAAGKSAEGRKELQLAADHLRTALGADHPETRLAQQLIQQVR